MAAFISSSETLPSPSVSLRLVNISANFSLLANLSLSDLTISSGERSGLEPSGRLERSGRSAAGLPLPFFFPFFSSPSSAMATVDMIAIAIVLAINFVSFNFIFL